GQHIAQPLASKSAAGGSRNLKEERKATECGAGFPSPAFRRNPDQQQHCRVIVGRVPFKKPREKEHVPRKNGARTEHRTMYWKMGRSKCSSPTCSPLRSRCPSHCR